MEARAQARYVRVTPMKARRVVDLIRGLPAADAQAVLRFAPQAASEPVGKVLDSAIANATNNHNMDPNTLVVSAAFVDEGPTLKRFRPRAQGRAYRIRKRTSHITVVVASPEDKATEVAAPRRRATKPAPAAAPKAEKATAAKAASDAAQSEAAKANEAANEARAEAAATTEAVVAEETAAAEAADAAAAEATSTTSTDTVDKEG